MLSWSQPTSREVSNEQYNQFSKQQRTDFWKPVPYIFPEAGLAAGVLLTLKVVPADTKGDAPDRFDALQREIESLKQHFGHYPHPVSGESWS